MCVRCKTSTKKYTIFGCGTFFVLLAIIIGLLWPIITTIILNHELELREGSLNYDNWVETPIPMYLRFRMFNWTNPDQIRNKNVKPHFVEMGPYVFFEKHRRVNITFNPENDTVSFYQIRTWHFVPEMSKGSLDDEVTTVNVMAAAAAYNVRHSNLVMRFAADRLIKSYGSLTVTKTVREFLFDGYNDNLLNIIKKIPIPGVTPPPFDKFGWFVDRNESRTYDGYFQMYSGQKDISRMGTLTGWNYVNKTKFYRGQCSEVSGTSGELWPVNMKPEGDITFFVSDLCRPLTLKYQQPHTRYGVTGSRWVGDNRVFDNGQKYEPNACYCTGLPSECPDLLYGVHNMSDCRYGAPAFASFPHFYLAHQSYVNAVSGLKPNQSQHEFSMSLEPTTGIPLEVDAKVQINIMIQPVPSISLYKGVPKVMIPAFWFEQTVELDEKLAKDAKIALQLPSIGAYFAFGVSGLGLILLLVGAIASCTKSWSDNYENLDDEITASSS